MRKTILCSALLSLTALSIPSTAAIAASLDRRLCFDAHLLEGGATIHFEFRVYNKHDDEAILLGEGCYPDGSNGGVEECSSGTGSLSAHNGKIELSFSSNELLSSTSTANGYAFQRASSHFLIDPETLKGVGATITEFPDQKVLGNVFSVKEGIIDSTVEHVTCGASHDTQGDKKLLNEFLKKVDKL